MRSILIACRQCAKLNKRDSVMMEDHANLSGNHYAQLLRVGVIVSRLDGADPA